MEKAKKKKIGAVLVQGGGIAGVQASLDLANSGFKVYLVENSAAIGGMMAHLDKTFPTGDCATCIVSPKLVECARNLNIEILTLSKIEKLEGTPGNFKATIRKSPRYIDEKICNDCGDCTKACPVEIADRYNRDLGKRKVIQKYSAQAIPQQAPDPEAGPFPVQDGVPGQHQRPGVHPADQEEGVRQGRGPDPGEKPPGRDLRPGLPGPLREQMHPGRRGFGPGHQAAQEVCRG